MAGSKDRIRALLRKKHRIYPFCITVNSRIFILEAGREKFILKERYPCDLNNEYRILALLQSRGFPYVPRTYGIMRLRGRPVIVQDYIEGCKLERDKRLFYENSDEIAAILAKLHLVRRQKARSAAFFLRKEALSVRELVSDIEALFDRSGPQQFSDYFIRGRELFNSILSMTRKCARRMDYPVKPSIINREMEFVIKGRRIYLLDWENACFGDYAYDIADLRYIYGNMDLARFVDIFKKNAGLEEDLSCRAGLYLPLILMKEFFYHILDTATCEFYRNIRPKVALLISKMKLDELLCRIEGLAEIELP